MAVDDREILDAGHLLASAEGIFACPEGAACVAAVGGLLRDGFLLPDDEVVIYNTGTGLKYLDVWETQFGSPATDRERMDGPRVPR